MSLELQLLEALGWIGMLYSIGLIVRYWRRRER
jgi:hypothetical protein